MSNSPIKILPPHVLSRWLGACVVLRRSRCDFLAFVRSCSGDRLVLDYHPLGIALVRGGGEGLSITSAQQHRHRVTTPAGSLHFRCSPGPCGAAALCMKVVTIATKWVEFIVATTPCHMHEYCSSLVGISFSSASAARVDQVSYSCNSYSLVKCQQTMTVLAGLQSTTWESIKIILSHVLHTCNGAPVLLCPLYFKQAVPAIHSL